MEIDAAKRALSLHFVLKVLTVGTNVAIARVASPEIFGQANINLLLLYTLVLHFTRECFRRVAQTSPQSALQLVRLTQMWQGTVCTWGFAPVAWALWPSADLSPMSTAIICLAASIEALAEPLYAHDLIKLEMKHRAIAEGFALILRSAVVLGTITRGVEAFALGQVAYAIAVVLLMRMQTGPLRWKGLGVERATGRLVGTELGLAVLKFVLSEGEKLVLLFFAAASAEQGVYALVASLGSIITRNLFQPIEVQLGRKPPTAFSPLSNRLPELPK